MKLKVSGVSFIRNALLYDYPVEESIRSILPICDEFVIAVGNSQDKTLELIQSIDSNKIKIINTVWDDSFRKGGRVLAVETNKAFKEVSKTSDWCFYIQADEIVHEKFLDTVYSDMQKHKDNKNVDGLLFDYLHFYGSYDHIADSYDWYKREVRVVRNDPEIYSYRDAQGFRKRNDQKLRVKHSNACVYHYGWVRRPEAMKKKEKKFHSYWHDDEWILKNVLEADTFDYSNINVLRLFKGKHPKVMRERTRNKNWKFDYDLSNNKYSFKERLQRTLERILKYRIGEYKNYKLI